MRNFEQKSKFPTQAKIKNNFGGGFTFLYYTLSMTSFLMFLYLLDFRTSLNVFLAQIKCYTENVFFSLENLDFQNLEKVENRLTLLYTLHRSQISLFSIIG